MLTAPAKPALTRFLMFSVVSLVGCGVVLLGAYATRLARPATSQAKAATVPSPVSPIRDTPLSFRPTVSIRGELDSGSAEKAVSRLRTERPHSVSAAVHSLRLFGRDARCVESANDPLSGVVVLDVLL